jgi:hypothetical protein
LFLVAGADADAIVVASAIAVESFQMQDAREQR